MIIISALTFHNKTMTVKVLVISEMHNQNNFILNHRKSDYFLICTDRKISCIIKEAAI